MKDHNFSKDVAERTNQEDPLVMYLIVRESLNMSTGKVGAQCGHAAQISLLQYFELLHIRMDEWIDSPYLPIFEEWLESSFRKVTLTADDKEWEKIKEIFVEGVARFTVVDAGLTQVPAGSETVMAIWPMRKSERPKILQKLQVLK